MVGSSGREYTTTQAPGEEVLGPFRITRLHAEVFAGLFGKRCHRRRDHGVAVEGVVLERIVLVPGLGKVALFEGIRVDDDGAATLKRVEIGLEAAGFIATSTFGASPGVVMS